MADYRHLHAQLQEKEQAAMRFLALPHAGSCENELQAVSGMQIIDTYMCKWNNYALVLHEEPRIRHFKLEFDFKKMN